MVEICNAAAICFGLKPALPMSNRIAIQDADRKRMVMVFNRENGNFNPSCEDEDA